MTNRIDDNIPLDEYHNMKDHLSSSGIRTLLVTPAHYEYDYIKHPEAYEPTDAQAVGAAVHKLALEGMEAFEKEFMVATEDADHRGRKPWKEQADVAEQLGKKLIMHKDFIRISEMANQLDRHTLAANILKNGHKEQSHFCEMPYELPSGEVMMIKAKARPDFIRHGDYIADYKTTNVELDVTTFSRHFFSFKNHVQGKWHKDVCETTTGKKLDNVIYVTQMQNPPYLVRIFVMEQSHMDVADAEIATALRWFTEGKQTGIWPGYPMQVETLIMPTWYGVNPEA